MYTCTLVGTRVHISSVLLLGESVSWLVRSRAKSGCVVVVVVVVVVGVGVVVSSLSSLSSSSLLLCCFACVVCRVSCVRVVFGGKKEQSES